MLSGPFPASLGFSGSARAGEGTPLELLKKTEDTEKQPRFQGKKITVDFSHSYPQVTYWKITRLGSRQERLEKVTPQGDQEEILITSGPEKLHYFIKQGVLIREIIQGEPQDFDPLRRNIDLARQNYTIETVGESQVGRHKVIRVQLNPRFSGRPQQEIWINPEAGLSLRSEVYGTGGKLSTLESFSEMEINPRIPNTALKINLPENVRKADFIVYPQPDLAAAARSFGQRIFLPDFLPPGFVLKGIVVNKIGENSRLQLIYSDGLTGLSVFEEKHQPTVDTALGLNPRDGGFFAVSRGLTQLLAFLRGNLKIVLVGELGKNEINQIAESLKPATLEGGNPSD
jgi:negative regulator of sigma E activity